jgi:adenosylcobinamide kinase/adenosylcobinamide-phosphate guanylyltransferase
MQSLFIGGIKSGKSALAEHHTLLHTTTKPYYLATTEFLDDEIQEKIILHKRQRQDRFITIEEPLALYETLLSHQDAPVLVECVSMWLNNMLHHNKSHQEILKQIDQITTLQSDITFVLNDVSNSVVSEHKLVRDFVNLSGAIGQKLAAMCDEVYHITAGIKVQIK